MPATIQLPLDLPDVEVLSTESRPAGALIIRVESTRKTTRCRVCGQDNGLSPPRLISVAISRQSATGVRNYPCAAQQGTGSV